MMVFTAWLSGLWSVGRHAWLVVVVYILLLIPTVPLAVKLHADLPPPATPFAVEPGAGPVPDADWLDEVTANKRSLVGALTPEVIGVAAPFENLDQLLEARPPMFAVLVSAVMLTVWAWLWGGVLSTFGGSSRRFFTACQESFSDLLGISIGSVVCALGAYAVIRLVVFGALSWAAGSWAESTLVAARIGATLLLAVAVALTTLVFDYARIAVVLDDVSLRAALTRGARVVTQHPGAVCTLLLLTTVMFAGLLAGYAAFEFIPGGSVPTVNRIIALGQAYIVARIVLRLWNAGAQVALYRRLSNRPASE